MEGTSEQLTQWTVWPKIRPHVTGYCTRSEWEGLDDVYRERIANIAQLIQLNPSVPAFHNFLKRVFQPLGTDWTHVTSKQGQFFCSIWRETNANASSTIWLQFCGAPQYDPQFTLAYSTADPSTNTVPIWMHSSTGQELFRKLLMDAQQVVAIRTSGIPSNVDERVRLGLPSIEDVMARARQAQSQPASPEPPAWRQESPTPGPETLRRLDEADDAKGKLGEVGCVLEDPKPAPDKPPSLEKSIDAFCEKWGQTYQAMNPDPDSPLPGLLEQVNTPTDLLGRVDVVTQFIGRWLGRLSASDAARKAELQALQKEFEQEAQKLRQHARPTKAPPSSGRSYLLPLALLAMGVVVLWGAHQIRGKILTPSRIPA